MTRSGHRPLAIALAIGGLLMIAPAAAQQIAATIDIAEMRPGTSPIGFQFARTGGGATGQWVVVEDPTAERGKAIAQISQDRTDYRFPLAIYQPVSARDVQVTLRFKPIAGRIDQAGGIAVRLTSPDDYYLVRANALENNVRFYRVTNGQREQVGGVDIPVPGGYWHMLGLRAEADRFTISYDGRVLFSAPADSYADTGQVALWTKADSITHFDTISITPLD